jgi:hypothetical protein
MSASLVIVSYERKTQPKPNAEALAFDSARVAWLSLMEVTRLSVNPTTALSKCNKVAAAATPPLAADVEHSDKLTREVTGK